MRPLNARRLVQEYLYTRARGLKEPKTNLLLYEGYVTPVVKKKYSKRTFSFIQWGGRGKFLKNTCQNMSVNV